MDTPESVIQSYGSERQRNPKSNNYPLEIFINNATSIAFDDSIFAWTSATSTLAGQTSGHRLPPNRQTMISAASNGCVQTVHGTLYYGPNRIVLTPTDKPSPNYCWTRVGWTIRVSGTNFIAEPMSFDKQREE